MSVTVVSYNDKRDAIDTTSRSKTWSRGLSPFFLGPVDLYDGHVAQNVENAWQYSKVYEDHVDEDGEPSDRYFSWSFYGWADKRAQRYPMGKGRIPLYSYWAGEKLSYIEARKKIYIPLYASAVLKSDAFDKLKQEYERRGEIVLRDFDGYDYGAEGKTLFDVVNDGTKKMGHAFVLAMLLSDNKTGDHSWTF